MVLIGDWRADPAAGTWPPGGELFHCHRRAYGPVQFNSTGIPQYRFSPIRDADGLVIPTWYAASSAHGAVAESLLHDIPIGVSGYLAAGQFQGRRVSTIRPARTLRLARLDHDGLRALSLRPEAVTETEADRYSQTALVAQRLHDESDLDGLVWVSRRRNIDGAVVLFGDRVGAADLEVQALVHDFDTIAGWSWLYEYVTPLGIDLAPPAL